MTAVRHESVTPTVRQAVARWRFWAAVVGVLVAVVVITFIVNGSGRVGTTFDPDNAAPAGGRALREVLRQQGVGVRAVTRLDTAASAGGTLLVDAAEGVLPASAWRRLAAAHDRVVVVSPDQTALEALLPEARQAGKPDRADPAAGCDLALARRAGTMDLDDVTRSLRDAGGTVCFRDAAGAGQLVTGRSGGARVILLADRIAFTNEHIGSAGNAAVALNALGAERALVWYVPSALDLGVRPAATLQDLTPPWVTPVAALLLLAGLAAAFWRGRRLGPLVIESLPVVVRSRETVEGRARLYERAGARLRAADSLRIGAIGRVAPLVGLSATAPVDQVIGAVSRLTGRHRDGIAALLLTASPANDRDLVRISDDLARMEAAVRAAAVPGATEPTKRT